MSMSLTTMGTLPILDSAVTTFSIFPEKDGSRGRVNLAYISKILLDKKQVVLKPITIRNFESWEDARTIGLKARLVTVEKISRGIFLGVYKDMANNLPKGRLELLIETDGITQSLGCISVCGKYDKQKYPYYLNVYGTFLSNTTDAIKKARSKD